MKIVSSTCIRLFYFIFLLCVFFISTKAQQQSISYIIARKDSNTLNITLQFSGSKENEIKINLPDEWAAESKLYTSIKNFKPITANCTIVATENPSIYILKNVHQKTITLNYDLVKDWEGEIVYPHYFRAIIQPDFFQFLGYNGLIYPAWDDLQKLSCSIEYVGFENQFKGNSFFSNADSKKFEATLGQLRNATYTAGNYRFKQFIHDGNILSIAVNGKFNFPDDDLYNTLNTIVTYERDFWKDKSQKYFFICVLPVQGDNYGGTAYYHSFNQFYKTNLGIKNGLEGTIAHEYFHTWLGQGLKMPDPEEIYKWFSEGFTEYYSKKFLMKAGITTEKYFIDFINATYKRYYLSPESKTINDSLVGNYWKSMDLKQLSYYRGTLIAFILDYNIAKLHPGKSLDDFMRELLQQFKDDERFSMAKFDEVFMNYGNDDLRNFINHANNGSNNEMLSLNGYKNYKADTIHINEIFDLGFNYSESRKAKKIVGLKNGSNAQLAGLYEGEETTGFSYTGGVPNKPAKIGVIKDGNKTVIEYLPARKIETIIVPQLMANE